MTLSSVLLVLLQVCSLHLMTVAKPICQMEGHIVRSAHHLLRDLGERFPARCLSYNTNISFPDSVFTAASASHSECPRVLGVLYESLEKAELVFADHELPVGEGGVTWDSKKFDKFQHLQHRLTENGGCLSSGDGALSSYFSNVTAILQQPDSAACGWMVLKRDLLRVMESTLQNHTTCLKWGGAR